jgi:4'-phosphopantetheinyl transferase EntD
LSLVSRVLAPQVAGAEIEDSGQPVVIHPQEAAMVARSGEKHRRDFTLGRFCAHAALAQLGGAGGAIGRGGNGAPVWPAGFSGSITHTAGYAAALVARTSCFLSLGVDAERVGGIGDNLIPRLFDTAERALLADLTEERRKLVATILFSAKEATFKALNPVTGKKLSFQDIHVELAETIFRATCGSQELAGNFAVGGDLVLTSAFLPAP